MRIKVIRFVVKVLGYEWGGDALNVPVWTVKAKKKKQPMALYEYDCMPCAQRYIKERSIKENDPGYT